MTNENNSLQAVLIRFLDRILNPDFHKKYIFTLLTVGLAFVGYPKATSWLAELEWNKKFFISISVKDENEVYFYIVGSVLLIASLFFFNRHLNYQKSGDEKGESELPPISVTNLSVSQPELLYDLATLQIEANGIPIIDGLMTLSAETLKRWDFRLCVSAGAVERFKHPSTSSIMVPATPGTSSSVNLVCKRNDTFQSADVCFYTDEIIPDRHDLGECGGFIVFLVRLTLSAEGKSDYKKNILVALYGGWTKTSGTYGISRQERTENIKAIDEIIEAANSGATVDEKVIGELLEIRDQLNKIAFQDGT